jgi:energy-coupling factor transporter ATP-binding protein EcfA2
MSDHVHGLGFQGFSFSYANSGKKQVRGVSLDIPPGAFVVMCGPTGCGKSTLLRALVGLVPRFYPGEFFGNIRVCNIPDTVQAEVQDLATQVGLVFQDPENQIVTMKVEREVAFGPENLGLPVEEIRDRTDRALAGVGITRLRDRVPSHLSGGEKQAVAVASVLAMKPTFVVLDEPTANLDPTKAAEVVGLLKTMQVEQALGIIVVEHRLDLVLPAATHVLLVRDGEVVLFAPVEDAINNPVFYESDINVPELCLLQRDLIAAGLWTGPILRDSGLVATRVSEILSGGTRS